MKINLFIFLPFIFVFLPSCSHKPIASGLPASAVYNASLNDVWIALQRAMIDYPIRINDQESGIIETERIRPNMAFKRPDQEEPFSSGYGYVLTARVIQGFQGAERSAVKVTLIKSIDFKKDFFAQPKKIESDRLEEKVILYRLDRELKIQRAINRRDQG